MARSTSLERVLVNDQLTAAGSFDNAASGLTATSVKGAIDELDVSVDSLLVDQHAAVTIGSIANGLFFGLDPSGQEIQLAVATTDDAGAMSNTDKTKLDGIEVGATADQTAGEIKTLYESNADTNAFTDAEQTKLGGIEAGATADQTGAEIKSLYEAEPNAFTDAQFTKLAGIEAGATGDQTGAEIKSLYEAEANTNAFTDAEQTKLAGIEAGATADQIASEVPVTLTATNYTAATADVEAHLVGLHTEIGSLQTQLVGGVTYVGGYNAATNTPDLEAPAGGAVTQGDMYTVTANGDFFTEAVTIGDVLIAEVDDPAALTDWTVVENNIEDAADVAYNNGTSGLTATNVQTAIDELDATVDTITSGSISAAGSYNPDVDFPSLDGQQRTITGTVTTNNTVNVVGSGTAFTTELASGDTLRIGGVDRVVDVITDDTNLTVTAAYTNSLAGAPAFKFGSVIAVPSNTLYYVSQDGNFYGKAISQNELLYAPTANPTTLAGWSTINENLIAKTNGSLGAVATGLNSVALGSNAQVETFGTSVDRGIAIGNTARVYGQTNSTTRGIAIGAEALVRGGQSGIAIGWTSQIEADPQTCLNGIAIGTAAVITAVNDSASDSIAIGQTALVTDSRRSVSLGGVARVQKSTVDTNEGVAIGWFSLVEDSFKGIAIGSGAEVNTANNAVQIGTGTNTTASTLQFLTTELANASGLVTGHTAVNYTAADTNVDTHLAGLDTKVGGLEGAEYVAINSTGTLPTASADDAIAIGENATASAIEGLTIGLSTFNSGVSSTVIGAFSNTTGTGTQADNVVILGAATDISSGDVNSSIGIGNNISVSASNEAVAIGRQASVGTSNRGIAIGYDAGVIGAANAVQIGIGNNTTASTVQYLGNRLANAEGLYTGHTATNYSPADADNVDSHFAAIDTEFANKADVAPQASTVNRETISVNKTLANGDEIYQHIITTTAALLVDLPASPVNGTHYIIKNASSSTESFTTNGVAIAPGNLYEVIYDGTEWVVL